MPTNTTNRGASIERSTLRGYLRRQIEAERGPMGNWQRRKAFEDVLEWVNSRPARYNAKAGGIGRQKKP